MTYPPPYNPALTLNSRRFFTISSPQASNAESAVTRPLNTSHGQRELREPAPIGSAPVGDAAAADATRPRTASTTASNPASEHRDGEPAGASAAAAHRESLDDSTLVASDWCSECTRESNTYLVEVTNYPSLQHSRTRSQVHAKADYDAVLLVYDVASRASFEAAKALHGEIPICTRKNHHHHHRRASHSSGAKSRTSGWFGGGGHETGATGSGEIVVALVGNKSDFDAEYASVELGLDGPLLEKEAEIQVADVEHRSLVHPLFRESRFYDELNLTSAVAERPLASPTSLGGFHMGHADARRSVLSADHDPRQSVLSVQRSVRTVPVGRRERAAATAAAGAKTPARDDKTASIETWLQTGKLSLEETREEEQQHDDLVEEMTRIDSNETESTTAAKRQVSRLEGETLARSLLLQVPFYETSAKTGENVEELFEATIREVLREMGRETTGDGKGKPCKHRAHHYFQQKKEKKQKKKDAKAGRATLAAASPAKPAKPAAEVVPSKEDEVVPAIPAIPAIMANPAASEEAAPSPPSPPPPPPAKDAEPTTAAAVDVVVEPPAQAADVEGRKSDVAVEDEVGEAAAETTAAASAEETPPTRKVKRRDSMMDRMRRVFMKKQQPAMAVSDIAAA